MAESRWVRIPTEGTGITPEDIMEQPFRRLGRFDFQCPLCQQEHRTEFYISLPATSLEEYQRKFENLIGNPEWLADIIQRGSIATHQERGDLDQALRTFAEKGAPGEMSPVAISLLDEEAYTCDCCGDTFKTVRLLREHVPGCLEAASRGSHP